EAPIDVSCDLRSSTDTSHVLQAPGNPTEPLCGGLHERPHIYGAPASIPRPRLCAVFRLPAYSYAAAFAWVVRVDLHRARRAAAALGEYFGEEGAFGIVGGLEGKDMGEEAAR